VVYISCVIRRLVFHFWYNSEEIVTCTDMVRIFQITGVLMVYIVGECYSLF